MSAVFSKKLPTAKQMAWLERIVVSPEVSDAAYRLGYGLVRMGARKVDQKTLGEMLGVTPRQIRRS
jgi:hypothetical protein